jgi:medium-chain acyl-[acyl-carrier-protein] hydrolase
MNDASPSDEWILQPRASSSPAFRLFCFPHAGGGASFYSSWAEELPSAVDVCPVQFPGREHLHLVKPFSDLGSLVRELSTALRPYLDLPFAFYGHSMGALVSFELARQLRRQFLPQPCHLFVSSHRAPQLIDSFSAIHELPDSEFLCQVQGLHGTPDAVLTNPELLELFIPLLRADFALCESYLYYEEPPLECSISCFGGIDDKRVTSEELAAWRDQTQQRLKLRLFPGHHFFLQSVRPLLLRVITQELKDIMRTLQRTR